MDTYALMDKSPKTKKGELEYYVYCGNVALAVVWKKRGEKDWYGIDWTGRTNVTKTKETHRNWIDSRLQWQENLGQLLDDVTRVVLLDGIKVASKLPDDKWDELMEDRMLTTSTIARTKDGRTVDVVHLDARYQRLAFDVNNMQRELNIEVGDE